MINTNQLRAGGHLIAKNIIMGVNKEKKKNWIMCNLTLQISENQRIDLSMFSNEFTSTGTKSKSYTALETIRDTYKSLDSTVTNKRVNPDAQAVKDEATTVATLEETTFVYANKGITIGMNRYMRDGEIQENFRLSVNFVNSAKETDPKEPYLEGTLTGVVTKKPFRFEEPNGEEYVKFELTVPTYQSAWGDREESVVVDKFELVMRAENFEEGEFEGAMDYVEDEFDENMVISVSIEPTVKVVASQEPVEDTGSKRGFGRKVEFKPSTRTVREIRVLGGYALEEDEYAEDKAFDFDLYSKAVEEFERKLEEIKADQGQTFQVQKGFGNAKKDSGTKLPF